MKGPVFQQLWEENKKFLLITGGGLVVFLFLNAFFVAGSRSVAETTNRRIYERLDPRVRELYNAVRHGYYEEEKRLSAYLEVESDLLRRYTITLPDNLESMIRGAPEIHYNQIIDGIWGELNALKTQQSSDCEIPVKLTTRELDVRKDDRPADHRRHHLYLEVVRRSMRAMVESGMRRIGKPRLHPEEVLFIRSNPRHQIVYQRVSFPDVIGPYSAFADVARSLQRTADPRNGGGLVQVLVLDLNSRGLSDPEHLRGQLEFAAFSIEEIPEDEAFSMPGRTRKRVGRR